MANEIMNHLALTMLSEEEQMFRDAIREFAEGEIAPTDTARWRRRAGTTRRC